MGQDWSGGQYSLIRWIWGSALFGFFVQSLIAKPWLGSWSTVEINLAPLLFDLTSSNRLNLPLLILCLPVTILLIIGQKDRLAAAFLILPSMMYFPGLSIFAGLHPLTLLLVLHLLTPNAPYGSLAALNRTDPAGSWHMPRFLPLVAGTLCLMGSTFLGLQTAMARGWLTTDLFQSENQTKALLSIVLILLSASLLWLVPLTRQLIWWLLMLVLPATSIFFSSGPLLGLWFLLLLSGPPHWPSRTQKKVPDYLFYDGSCGLCHRACRFVLAEDTNGLHFSIAPLFGPTFEELVKPSLKEELPDSMVIRGESGHLFTQAQAARQILKELGGYWRFLEWMTKPIPLSLMNRIYNFIATYRHRWFSPPADACPLLPPHLRARFKP